MREGVTVKNAGVWDPCTCSEIQGFSKSFRIGPYQLEMLLSVCACGLLGDLCLRIVL